MKKIVRCPTTMVFGLVLLLCYKCNEVPKLLLVSFDGFCYRYLNDYNLTNFEEFRNEGIYTKVKPCFTTLTFPNHYSLATGLVEEKHGIVANVMYDKFLNQTFNATNALENNVWWQQNPNVMPIWIANQLGNGSRSSGAIGFVGSVSPISQHRIDRVLEYNENRTYKEIVNNITQWFMGKNPINFGAIYFHEPDKTGHSFGPLSKEIASTLQHCDNILYYLKTSFQNMGLWDAVNIIITTDHGMAEVNANKSIVLEHYIDIEKVILGGSATLTNIYVDDPALQLAIHKNLSNIANYDVFFRHSVPKEYHYNNNIRIGDVVLVAQEGYVIFPDEFAKKKASSRGQHGFNNSLDSMSGIFMARGPSIKKGGKVDSDFISIVDIYPFMTKILQLPQRDVDGNLTKLEKFISPPAIQERDRPAGADFFKTIQNMILSIKRYANDLL